MKTLRVQSVFGNYEVTFVDALSRELHRIALEQQIHLLVDARVFQLYKKELEKVPFLSSYKFDAQEKNKKLSNIETYCRFLLSHNVQKRHALVVVGGGLVQDIGSFSAHILKRGMRWIFVPTTLLSMADSCIGGKSGINVGTYKNQIGAFYPPSRIIIYPSFLRSLSSNDRINGIGEIFKHGLIKGGASYQKIQNLIQYVPKDNKKSAECIGRSLQIKKEIIEEDELDTGRRKLLNYGHTFGHALEGYTKNKIPHGLGVLIGMDMANYISVRRGLLSADVERNISKILWKHIYVDSIPIQDVNVYMNFLSQDKKAMGSFVQALLCKGVGNIVIQKIQLDNVLASDIDGYIQSVRQRLL